MASYNELIGLGSHSADANLQALWRLQESGSDTTAAVGASSLSPIATLDGTYTGFGGTLATATGPTNYLTSAIDFSASEYVDVGSANDFKFHTSTNIFSFACWLKVNSVTGRYFFAGSTLTALDTGFMIGFENGAGFGTKAIRYRAVRGSGNSIIDFRSPDNVITDTNWHHVAITSSAASNSGAIYVDGSDVGTLTYTVSYNLTTTLDPSNTLNFGRSQSSSINLDGQLAGIASSNDAWSSAEVAELYNGPEPVNSVAPSVSGTEAVGQTLSCSTGTWGLGSGESGTNGTITYSYQWTRSDNGSGLNEADIGGATSSTYTLVGADEGKYIRCRVRASNDGGFDSDADTNSNFTGAIAASGGATTAVGSASGTATASGTGSSTFETAGSSAGSATATAGSASTATSAGSAAGIATATAVGSSMSASAGSSAGSSTATAISTGTITAAGSSAGTATALAAGSATAAATGSAAGTSTATATYGNVASGAGSASGSAIAAGVGALVAAAIASANGIATALAVSEATITSVGSAAGSASATAVSVGGATYIRVSSAYISVPKATGTIVA